MSSTTAFCSLILRSTLQQPTSPTLPAVAGSRATLSRASRKPSRISQIQTSARSAYPLLACPGPPTKPSRSQGLASAKSSKSSMISSMTEAPISSHQLLAASRCSFRDALRLCYHGPTPRGPCASATPPGLAPPRNLWPWGQEGRPSRNLAKKPPKSARNI